jgi:hypothetical protein
MSLKRVLLIALIALAAVPASAAAQAQVNPPEGDNYLFPIPLNGSLTNPPPFPSTQIGFVADTSTYTTQPDMYNPPQSGGPPEPTNCGTATNPDIYGNTIWSVFFSNRYGVMDVSTAGPFDTVIGVVPFQGPSNPTPELNLGYCQDSLSGFQEETQFLVGKNRWYAIQVGGTLPTGGATGGQVQVKFSLTKPPTVGGDAFLFWKVPPLRVTTAYVKNVPKGETVTLSCTKGACRKKTINVKSKPIAPLFSGKIATPPPGVHMGGSSEGRGAVTPDLAFRQIVREAKAKVALLTNQQVKSGAKIELRITRPGYIGKYYVWKVSGSSISSATKMCLNPGSTKPRKSCHG